MSRCPQCEKRRRQHREYYASLTPEQKRARLDKCNANRRARYHAAKAKRESDETMDQRAAEWLKRNR